MAIMKELMQEVNAVASEFTAKEWAAIVAGVVIFAILSGVC